ncbi:sulfotransferase [Aliiroseovarius marinus]|uniref:sulfotransferase n=1 Tax=Aliiroseovarius marinus TaxID=2500159 RepID=UPI003D7E297B
MVNKIAIHSVPRSGSTWLGEIFNSAPSVKYCYQPLFSYALKGALTPEMSKDVADRFFEACQTTEDDFILQSEARESGKLPQFDKASHADHVVYKEVRYHHILPRLIEVDASVKLVLLIRSPLSVVSSWLRAPKEFRAEWDVATEWRAAPSKNAGKPEEFNGFEKWLEATRMFHDLQVQAPERVTLVKYRDLLMSPEAEAERLFGFTGLPFGKETRDFLESSTGKHNPDHYSVFRSKQSDDKWRSQLDPAIAEEIISETKSAGFEDYL